MELTTLSLPLLFLIFTAAAAVIWVAGIHLSKSVDTLSGRFHLGQALGGAILLAIVTNLPEIAITVSAALKGSLDLAIGNILGGIALQTVVLVLLDALVLGKKGALTYMASSMSLLLESLVLVMVLILVVIGHQLPASLSVFHISPASFAIVGVWVFSLILINKAGKGLPWKKTDEQQAPADDKKASSRDQKKNSGSTGKIIFVFLLCALFTLIAGVLLEASGDAIAQHFHLDGLIFGATVLALATSLPEISTGMAAIRLGDYQLAMSDILGGNAFLPVLFLLASAIAGKPALPQAHPSDLYLTGVAILLTLVYSIGLIFRSKKQYFRMGMDSLAVLLIYILSIAGLFFISG
ncbi:sodium:calcium antiporter [Chryseobacterium hagamense]|uniref:Sodium/calcium exchanger membrane region domain-containing protein n=1 Tax=Chryseobacterium hagamense TaxID=395935 RepID=A0A511YGK0_9FLAO|nr:sodium:calcium antiporter [Chryseobacterium hagamense]GEN74309.1 hypothetical protein CHA01nite_00490 [Chryseobacterium hagamense]